LTLSGHSFKAGRDEASRLAIQSSPFGLLATLQQTALTYL